MGCLKLSFHTPVSFEHDFLEDESAAEPKELTTKVPCKDSEPVRQDIVWNAKVILMSGLSRSALENLSSDKNFGDHVPHICNILRFAVLKKDHSFMAIGGPWNCSDGSDPSVDDSSLIQTALRYAKDITQLDLWSCQHWHRFLEIHYDRIGKDGLFSHKEITVLFVPDLLDCLPSLETWRQQWLAHKNAVAEREWRRNLKDERSGDRMEGTQDKGLRSLKDSKVVGKSEKNNGTSGENGNGDQKDKNTVFIQGGETEERSGEHEKKDAGETAEVDKDAKAIESGETTGAQAAGAVKTGKKKIIRKIVKQKVADKKAIMEKSDGKQSDKLDKDTGDGNTKSEMASVQNEPSVGVKTFIRKKVVKKVPMVKEGLQSEVKADMETGCAKGESQEKTDPDIAMVRQDSGAKTTVKRKIIKKVPKKKAVEGEANVGVADSKKDGGEQIVVREGKMDKPVADIKSQVSEVNKSKKKVISKKNSQASVSEKQNASKTSETAESVVNEEEKKDEKGVEEKIVSSTKAKGEAEKQKAPEKDVHKDKNLREGESKNDKEKKDANQKDESMRKSDEDAREKRKIEEPPRPGLILQTKVPKGSKLRSLSLSLDSLLDYSDKDAEESSFELSVFAESLYEMLQYQMGCRLFNFLQELRTKFITKRNERKRRREETQGTENYKKAPKQLKTSELPPGSKSATLETADVSAKPDDEKPKDKDDTNDNADDERMNEGADNNEDLEEDPEEDPEEFDEMEETASQLETSKEASEQVDNSDVDTGPEKIGGDKESGAEEPAKDKESAKDKSSATTPGSKPDHDTSAPVKGEEVGTGMKQAAVEDSVVNKELLQAFRFFDRNRVGYIRVEDMRLIIHSLGKFLSHRDVKELVACALWESNTGRDDRILYEKLVRMSDV